jgi:hypothetical protein
MAQIEQDPFWLLTESMAQDTPTWGEGFVIAEAEEVLITDQTWEINEPDYAFFWEDFKVKAEPIAENFTQPETDFIDSNNSEDVDIQVVINQAKQYLDEEPKIEVSNEINSNNSEDIDIQAVINQANKYLDEEPKIEVSSEIDLNNSEDIDIQAVINQANKYLDEEPKIEVSNEIDLNNSEDLDIQGFINQAKQYLDEEPKIEVSNEIDLNNSEDLDIQGFINQAKQYLDEEPKIEVSNEIDLNNSEDIDIQAVINQAKQYLDEEPKIEIATEPTLENNSEIDDSEGWKIIQRILGESGESFTPNQEAVITNNFENNSNESDVVSNDIENNSDESHIVSNDIENDSNESHLTANVIESDSNESNLVSNTIENNSNESNLVSNTIENNSNESDVVSNDIENDSNESQFASNTIENNSNESNVVANDIENDSNESEVVSNVIENDSDKSDAIANVIENDSNESHLIVNEIENELESDLNNHNLTEKVIEINSNELQNPPSEPINPVSETETKPAENTITQDSKTNDMLYDFAIQDQDLESFAKSADNAAQNGGSMAQGDLDLDAFANPKADDLFVNSTANHDDNDTLVSDTTIDRYAELVKTIQNSIEFMQTTQAQFNTIQNLATDLPNSSPSNKVDFDYDRERSYMDKLRDKLFDNDRDRIKVSADVKEEVVRKFAYLKTKIGTESGNYSKWESKSKKWALFFQILTATLAGIVTVILGIKLSNAEVVWWLNTIALVMTVSISILGVVQRFFDADEKYAKYQDTHYKLQLLLNDIEYLELGIDYVTLADANALQAEFSRILASTYEYEMQLIAGDEKEVNKIKQQGIAK